MMILHDSLAVKHSDNPPIVLQISILQQVLHNLAQTLLHHVVLQVSSQPLNQAIVYQTLDSPRPVCVPRHIFDDDIGCLDLDPVVQCLHQNCRELPHVFLYKLVGLLYF